MKTIHAGDCETGCNTCSENYHDQFAGNTCDTCMQEIPAKDTCILCNEIIEDIEEMATENGERCCYGCYESEIDYAGSVVYLDPKNQEPITYTVSENFSFDQYGDYVDRNLISVDAEGFPTIANTTQVSDGTDLWGMDTDIRDVAERLRDDHAEGLLPFPVYVSVKQTGNFAVYMAVHVDPAYESDFRAWLNGDSQEDGE